MRLLCFEQQSDEIQEKKKNHIFATDIFSALHGQFFCFKCIKHRVGVGGGDSALSYS